VEAHFEVLLVGVEGEGAEVVVVVEEVLVVVIVVHQIVLEEIGVIERQKAVIVVIVVVVTVRVILRLVHLNLVQHHGGGLNLLLHEELVLGGEVLR